MPFQSLYEHIDIPQSNVLTYIFGNGSLLSNEPIWIDAKNPQKNLSPHQLLQWVRRLGLGLQRLGLKRGDVVMICTPNHIFVPVAYLGIAGSAHIFSGANPISTVPGMSQAGKQQELSPWFLKVSCKSSGSQADLSSQNWSISFPTPQQKSSLPIPPSSPTLSRPQPKWASPETASSSSQTRKTPSETASQTGDPS